MKRPLVLLAAGLALVLGACAARRQDPHAPGGGPPASTEAPAQRSPIPTGWHQPVPAFWTRSSRRSSWGV